jgi:hypothetical protein
MDNLITSVLGMNLKAEIRDIDGNLIPTGCKKTIHPAEKVSIKLRILDKRFFTHYNEALLAKIRDFRRLND